MKVWLDDERPAPSGWTHVHTYDEAVSLINRCIYEGEPITEMSLDHDLADFDHWGLERDGHDVLVYFEQLVRLNGFTALPLFHIHSANPPARKRMEAAVASLQRLVSEAGEQQEITRE